MRRFLCQGVGCFPLNNPIEFWEVKDLPSPPQSQGLQLAYLSPLLIAFTTSHHIPGCCLLLLKLRSILVKHDQGSKDFPQIIVRIRFIIFPLKFPSWQSAVVLVIFFSYVWNRNFKTKFLWDEKDAHLSLHEAITISVSRHNDIS